MIKNLGGVFGRNPTFNNVEVEGDLTVDGSIIGPVVVDANTLTGTTLASNVVNSSLTSVGTLSALTVTATIAGSINGNAATATTATTAGTVTNPNLTGEVTTSGLTATVVNSAVIGKVLTGYTSGAGTVAATDTILQAIQKLNGNTSIGGSDTQVQFNNAGVLDANAGFTYDSTNEILRVRSHPTRYFTIGGNAAGASEILGYGNRPLAINSVENSIDIGDVDAVVNSTYIQIDDPSSAMYISCPNGTINVDSPTVMLTQGSITLGASAIIDASSATALAINSTVPAGTGVTPTIQVICPSSATALTSGATAQNVFSPVGFDTISVQAATTYMFDGFYLIKTTGTTTHTISMSFALTTATITNCTWTTMSYPLASTPTSATRTQDGNFFTAVAGGLVNSTNATAFNVVKFEGIMRVNAAGSVVPQITFSAAPGGTNTLEIGSYLRFYPIGSNTIDSVGTAIG